MASQPRRKLLDAMKLLVRNTENVIVKDGAYKPSGGRAWLSCGEQSTHEIVSHAIENAEEDNLEPNGSDAMGRRMFTLQGRTSSQYPVTVKGAVGESEIEIEKLEDH